jgi:DNA polymerase-3 subunit gamma/tau
MPEYQVLARKYRPQSFVEVLGQSAIVTTLKNAIKFNRLAHAYLFCGSRGTGKTTLARVFAKALNCQAPTSDGEPCNVCSSCREIAAGNSLDVLEIDGASHRGIDDIRQINETVGYAASSGKYKIYIIDEVHMLTKEAFNALLKTLEEPPPKVVFLFATTEPHKVLPTILSRCQRFNLNRIPTEHIIEKLQKIALDLHVEVEHEALRLLAHRADGGLRDAESLFDQIIAFHEGNITAKTISDVLGIVPRETLFILDQAGKEGRLSVAFDIAYQIFSEGKDIIHFIETLTEHFRTLLLIKLSGPQSHMLLLSEADILRYEASSKLYSHEQCLTILDFLIEAQQQIRFQPSSRIALEAILLRIMRSHQRLPIEFLVRRLTELEQAIGGHGVQLPPAVTAENGSTAIPKIQTPGQIQLSVTEDPTPSRADLGLKPQKTAPKLSEPAEKVAVKIEIPPPMHKQSHYDTILQFAAVELEGTLKKHINTLN